MRAGIVLQELERREGLSRNWRGEKGLGFAGEVEAAGSTEGWG